MFKPFPAFFQGKVRVSAKKSVILHIETPQSSACGGIGRRARLRIWCPTMCRFESCQAHEAGGSFGPPAFVFFQSSLLRRFFLRFAMKASKLDDESCQAHEAGGSFGPPAFVFFQPLCRVGVAGATTVYRRNAAMRMSYSLARLVILLCVCPVPTAALPSVALPQAIQRRAFSPLPAVGRRHLRAWLYSSLRDASGIDV